MLIYRRCNPASAVESSLKCYVLSVQLRPYMSKYILLDVLLSIQLQVQHLNEVIERILTIVILSHDFPP